VAPTQVIVIPVTVPSIPPLVFGIGGRDPDAVSPNVAEEWSVRDDDQKCADPLTAAVDPACR